MRSPAIALFMIAAALATGTAAAVAKHRTQKPRAAPAPVVASRPEPAEPVAPAMEPPRTPAPATPGTQSRAEIRSAARRVLLGIVPPPQGWPSQLDAFWALESEAAFEELRALWNDGLGKETRIWILHGAERRDPGTLTFEIMHLGMKDPELVVRQSARSAIERLSLADFADPGAYDAWRERTEGLTAAAILDLCASDWIDQARNVGPDEVDPLDRLNDLVGSSPVCRLLPGAGLGNILASRLLSSDRFDAVKALWTVEKFDLGREWCESNVIPLLSRQNLRENAIAALASPNNAWAVPHLTPILRDPDEQVAIAAAKTLARIGDHACVPALIDLLKSARGPGNRLILAEDVLPILTGARPPEEAGSEWWEEWWRSREKK